MNPLLVLTLIRGAIRLGRTADSALAQYGRDKEALLPYVEAALEDTTAKIIDGRFLSGPYGDMVREPNGRLQMEWKARRDNAPGTPEFIKAETTLYMEAVKLKAADEARARKVPASEHEVIAGGVMVAQWAKGKGPVSPHYRMALALVDVGLEYIGANPSVLGIGGEGEKLVGAVAANLSNLIPDSTLTDAYGPKEHFAERLAGIFLHAGLKALVDNPQAVSSEKHLQALVKSSLTPLVSKFPANITEQADWLEVTDTLLGPAANAAMQTLLDHQEAFLGRKFELDDALGALTSGFLKAAVQNNKLTDNFTRQGMIGLFQALAGVVATRPELFLNREGSDADKVAQDVVVAITGTLAAHKEPFNGELGIAIAGAALDALRSNARTIFDDDDAWENVAATAIEQVLGGFTDALVDPAGTFDSPFSHETLIELARIILTEASMSPRMLTGGSKEVQQVVAAVAGAMAADKHLLLSDDDWLQIAAIAARETLQIGTRAVFDEDDPWAGVASQVLEQILAGFEQGFTNEAGEFVSPFSHDTLRELARIVLIEASKSPRMIVDGSKEVKRIVAALSAAMAADRQLLLKDDDWLQIAAVVTREAARNPGRLFGFDAASPSGALGSELISSLLGIAADDLNRRQGGVLFGETLREAIVETLRTASGNVAAVIRNKQHIATLAQEISRLVREQPNLYGNKEWLRLFKALLPKILKDGSIGDLTSETIKGYLVVNKVEAVLSR